MRLLPLILATTGLTLLLTLILLPGSHTHSQPLASKRPNAVQSAVLQIPLTTGDLVFSPNNQTIYASVPASASSHANSLLPLNPISGTTGTAIPIGPDPGQLGMSTNGQWLYVGLNATHSVKRFNVQSQTQGLEFDLGLGVSGLFNRAGDIAAVPGAPDSIAISLRTGFQHGGVAIYDNGVARTNTTPAHLQNDRIEYGATPDVIYGYNISNTGLDFRKLAVDSNGVTFAQTTSNIFRGLDIKFANGLVYGTEGQVFNPETRTLVGKFPVPTTIGDAVAIDTAAARAYILSTSPGSLDKILTAYNLNTFIAVSSLVLPPMVGRPTSLIVAGAGALAFRDDTRVFLIPTSALVPVSPTPLPIPTVNSNGVIKLSLATQDLIFDPGTQKIYASLPARAGTFGNSLAPIDAVSGNVSTPVFVGSEPSLLAISDNNQYVYAALDGQGAVRRFNLARC